MRLFKLGVVGGLGLCCSVLLLGGACSDAHPELKPAEIDPPLIETDPWGAGTGDPTSCGLEDSCEDGDPCTVNRCVDGQCVAIPIEGGLCCDPVELFTESFDGGAMPLELDSVGDSAGWSVSSERYVSPTSALYFGDPLTQSYDTGERVAGGATLPPLLITEGRLGYLTFRLLSLIEKKVSYDRFWIEADVLDEQGTVTETHTVMQKHGIPPSAYNEFALVEVPLHGLDGQFVRLRFSFDSMDAMNNTYEGLYVDDIDVLAGCPILETCEVDSQCDDADPCTLDACSDQGCAHLALEDCEPEGLGEGPCDGPDAPEDCCISDEDCDDGDATTIDTCEGATCVHTLNPDVCLEDLDCDDGDACTADTCNDGVCEFAGASGEGCCEPDHQILADFDTGKHTGVYVTDNLETGIFWTTDKTRATTGEYSLYCGDPVGQTYDIGERVKSSATTPLLSIPSGGVTKLEFDLFKATRGHRDYDVFQVFVLRHGALHSAWSSKGLKSGQTDGHFDHIEVPLDTYAGQDIQLRFVFDSVDAPPAAHEGVYFDTLELITGCQ